MSQDAVVLVSEEAAAYVANQLAQRNKGVGIRLGVKPSGCSGMSYALEYADAVRSDDVSFKQHGVDFVMAKDAVPFLQGAQLVIKQEGLNRGLEFENPNAKNPCGCGESFSVD